MVLFRGACMVLFGGHAWFYLGGHAWFYSGVCAWFYPGGVHGFIWGGMHGFIWGVHGFIRGACVVLFGGHAWFYSGGMCGFIWGGMRGFSSFFGYNEIRSMSGRYVSYWNAFLFRFKFSPYYIIVMLSKYGALIGSELIT